MIDREHVFGLRNEAVWEGIRQAWGRVFSEEDGKDEGRISRGRMVGEPWNPESSRGLVGFSHSTSPFLSHSVCGGSLLSSSWDSEHVPVRRAYVRHDYAFTLLSDSPLLPFSPPVSAIPSLSFAFLHRPIDFPPSRSFPPHSSRFSLKTDATLYIPFTFVFFFFFPDIRNGIHTPTFAFREIEIGQVYPKGYPRCRSFSASGSTSRGWNEIEDIFS